MGRRFVGAAELGDDRAEAGQRRGGGEEENGDSSFVLARRVTPHPVDIRRRHDPEGEDEVEADPDVPAEQHAGGAMEARRPQCRNGDADQRREEQPRPDADDPQRAPDRIVLHGGGRHGRSRASERPSPYLFHGCASKFRIGDRA